MIDWTAVGSISTAIALAFTAATFAGQASDARRSQAARISIVPGNYPYAEEKDQAGKVIRIKIPVAITNRSDEPIYEVIPLVNSRRSLVIAMGVTVAGGQTLTLEFLAPGGVQLVYGAGVRFRDSNGRSWHRRLDGRLLRVRRWTPKDPSW